MKLTVYLDIPDAVLKRRIAELFHADADVRLVGNEAQAQIVVQQPVVETSGSVAAEEDATLTTRELEVLRLAAHGLANKEIAASLDISPHTVKYHLAAILEKLDVSSRTEAVAVGIRTGLVPL